MFELLMLSSIALIIVSQLLPEDTAEPTPQAEDKEGNMLSDLGYRSHNIKRPLLTQTKQPCHNDYDRAA